jgi:glutaredoxin
MNKKIVLISVLLIFLIGLSSYALAEHGRPAPVAPLEGESALTLYVGRGCPHCANVESYIATNDIEKKISIAQKEVYYDRKNAAELATRAERCGMPTDSIGVPFLWTGSTCIVGDQDIIGFLASTTADL